MVRGNGLVAASAAFALAAPSAALAVGPPNDSVRGGGISALGTKFQISAKGDAEGQDARGHAAFRDRFGGDRSGKVTCLRVSGNTAVIGIKDRNDTTGEVVYRQFFVRDNGNPVGGVGVDELKEVGSGSPTELPCADPTTQGAGLVIEHGNIVVRDA